MRRAEKLGKKREDADGNYVNRVIDGNAEGNIRRRVCVHH